MGKVAANQDAKKRAAATESAKSVPDVSPKVSKTHSMPKTTDSQPEDAANQDAKNSADSEAESAKSEANVALRVAKTQGLPTQTDSQPEDTAKALGLSGHGRLGVC